MYSDYSLLLDSRLSESISATSKVGFRNWNASATVIWFTAFQLCTALCAIPAFKYLHTRDIEGEVETIATRHCGVECDGGALLT